MDQGDGAAPRADRAGGRSGGHQEFLGQYRDLLRKAYPAGPHGTVFPFRRIFAVARKAG